MESTLQQILIPTDFSNNAFNAADYALRFFNGQNITFHFLHINTSVKTFREEVASHQDLNVDTDKAEIENKMRDWIQNICTNHSNPNHNMKLAMISAPFVEGIRDYINYNNIQFMVMGSKGASGIEDSPIGSKTSAVITRVKCPILVIPEKAFFKKPINIGFPTDFNMVYNETAIRTLLEVTNMYRSTVKILRVAQTEKELENYQNNNKNLLKILLGTVPHTFHVIENPFLENALQSFVTTMQIDLVVMIAKNLNFFQRILLKPQIEKISYHMQIPFLLLHE